MVNLTEDSEVAGFLGISQDEYHAILKDSAGCRLFSFEEVVEKSESGFDVFEEESPNPLDGIERESFQRQLADAIRHLPEREQLVLALYYDEELKEAVADHYREDLMQFNYEFQETP